MKNCKDNLTKTGWIAINKMTMADVMVLTWMSIYIFNPFRE